MQDANWLDLFGLGNIETYEIPDHHQYRRNIMNDPYMQMLTWQLADCIESISSGFEQE